MPASASSLDRARDILDAMQADTSLIPEKIAEWWSGYLQHSRDRYLETLGFLDPVGSRVLEVGSIPCQFTLLLQQLGYDVRGTDLAPERVRGFLEAHELTVDEVDIETGRLPYADGSFDQVLFLEVLEHLRVDPFHALREVARVLKPGGRMLLSTPNVTPAHRLKFFFDRPYQGDLVAEFRKLEEIGHMGHFRLYTLTDMRALLGEVGLDIERISFHGEYATPTWATKWLRLAWPGRRDVFRTYTFVQARTRA